MRRGEKIWDFHKESLLLTRQSLTVVLSSLPPNNNVWIGKLHKMIPTILWYFYTIFKNDEVMELILDILRLVNCDSHIICKLILAGIILLELQM